MLRVPDSLNDLTISSSGYDVIYEIARPSSESKYDIARASCEVALPRPCSRNSALKVAKAKISEREPLLRTNKGALDLERHGGRVRKVIKSTYPPLLYAR